MKKIKFSIRLFIITFILLLFIQLPIYATTGKATVDTLRIRKTPSTTAEVINVLAIGESVEVIAEEGDWYKVVFKGAQGYVSKQYLKLDGTLEQNNSNENNTSNESTETKEQNTNNNVGENIEQTQTPVEQEPTVNNKVYSVAENAQVYILPVITSEIIGDLKENQTATVLNSAGLWVYVQSDNIKGWIRIDKLSTENVETVTPNTGDNNSQTNTEQNVEQNTEQNTQDTPNTPATPDNQTDVTTNTTPVESKVMYVKPTVINVRTQSNTSSDIICGLEQNAEVKVIGEENGWYKVEVKNQTGFIRNDLLSNTKVEVTSRDNEIERENVVNMQNASNTQQTNNKQETVQTQQTQAQQNQTTQPQEQQTQTNQQQAQQQPSTSSKGVTGADIVAYAKQFEGYRYVYGAAGPNAFDCSGFTMYVYAHFGYSLSHSSRVQATQGVAVSGDLQPGDILVFTNGGTQVGHVGIYIGNDKFIHASDSTTGVIISNLHDRWNISKYVGARRIL